MRLCVKITYRNVFILGFVSQIHFTTSWSYFAKSLSNYENSRNVMLYWKHFQEAFWLSLRHMLLLEVRNFAASSRTHSYHYYCCYISISPVPTVSLPTLRSAVFPILYRWYLVLDAKHGTCNRLLYPDWLITQNVIIYVVKSWPVFYFHNNCTFIAKFHLGLCCSSQKVPAYGGRG